MAIRQKSGNFHFEGILIFLYFQASLTSVLPLEAPVSFVGLRILLTLPYGSSGQSKSRTLFVVYVRPGGLVKKSRQKMAKMALGFGVLAACH
jgi:hypothetical protein